MILPSPSTHAVIVTSKATMQQWRFSNLLGTAEECVNTVIQFLKCHGIDTASFDIQYGDWRYV